MRSATAATFEHPRESFSAIDAETAARVIEVAVDVALIIDTDGIIRDLAFGSPEPTSEGYRQWLGAAWVETVTPECRGKVQALLDEAARGGAVRAREINQRAKGLPDLPVSYSAVRLDDEGRVLALGRDLRAVATLQQKLVEAHQAMEREYARLRHAETRYRMLFRLALEAILIVDAATLKIVEANPAAERLLETAPDALKGKLLATAFSTYGWSKVEAQLSAVGISGWADEVRARLVNGEDAAVMSSLFRQDRGSMLLVRLAPAHRVGAEGTPRAQSVFDVMAGIPDAFVVIDGERRVQHANDAFLELVELATEAQVLGKPLETWLGRPGVDVNILMANLREHSSVRGFATVIRGEYGAVEQADVSGVACHSDEQACYGFVIRALGASADVATKAGLQGSVENLAEMVGRVSLKEIIRETTDVIERRCIEAALEVSGDNRASAAQLLGLSRQSLYAKLRRYGLGDLEPDDGGGG